MELKVDDKTVFAATGGKPFDPDLPAVIFVHGAGMDHTIWALQDPMVRLARLRCAGDRPAGARQIRRTGIEKHRRHGRLDGPPGRGLRCG